AEVEMADLRVAHLPGRQPDRVLRRPEASVRPAIQHRPPVRHRRARDRVVGGIRADPEAVEDDEDDRAGPILSRACRAGRHPTGVSASRAFAVSAARATIPAISSGLSEAPPTSAPSIAGSARNSPIAPEVTLPPYRIGTASPPPGKPSSPSVARIASAMAAASEPLAVRPVPIAQTGS